MDAGRCSLPCRRIVAVAVTRFVLAAWILFTGIACSDRPLKPDPAALSAVTPELLDQLRADPFNYFRFINHEWTERTCEIFAGDLSRQPIETLSEAGLPTLNRRAAKLVASAPEARRAAA